MYKQDLALNNKQGLICHKTQLIYPLLCAAIVELLWTCSWYSGYCLRNGCGNTSSNPK